MELENNNNDFLALPENLKLNGYNSDWVRYLTLKYQNSSDSSDEYSKVKIDLFNNQILPIYPKIDDSTKKWFGSGKHYYLMIIMKRIPVRCLWFFQILIMMIMVGGEYYGTIQLKV